MSSDSGSGAHASHRGDSGSEAIPLPIASQSLLSHLRATVVGFEDPKSGRVALGLQFVVPPLTEGAVPYFQKLAPYLKALGQAIPTRRVWLLDARHVVRDTDVDEPRSQLNKTHRHFLATIALDLEVVAIELEHARNPRLEPWAFELGARIRGLLEAILRDSDDVGGAND